MENLNTISYKRNHVFEISVEPRVFYEVDIYFDYDEATENTLVAVLSWIEGKGRGMELFDNLYNYLKKLANNNQLSVRLEIEPTTPSGEAFTQKLVEMRGLDLNHEKSRVFATSCDYLIIQPD